MTNFVFSQTAAKKLNKILKSLILEFGDYMSDNFLKVFQSGNDRAFQLYEKFLAICSNDLWDKKAGGWPICTQYYHGLSATAKLASSLGTDPAEDPCPGAGNLLGNATIKPSKEQAALFLQNVRIQLSSAYEKLTDSLLLKQNDPISGLTGSPITNAGVLELIASHMLYHLGSCDAALRDAGFEGAF